MNPNDENLETRIFEGALLESIKTTVKLKSRDSMQFYLEKWLSLCRTDDEINSVHSQIGTILTESDQYEWAADFLEQGNISNRAPHPSGTAVEEDQESPTKEIPPENLNGYITPEGLWLFDNYLKAKGRFLEFQNHQYNFYLDRGNREEAEFRLELMFKLAYLPHEYALYWAKKGGLMERDRNFSAAAEAYREGLEYDQDDPTLNFFLRNNLGYSLNQLGQFSEGESWCRKAIEFDRKRPNAHKNLGLSLQGQGKYIEAADSFRQAVRTWPPDFRAYNHLVELVKNQPDLGITHPEYLGFIIAADPVIRNANQIAGCFFHLSGDTSSLSIPTQLMIAATQEAAGSNSKVISLEELRQRIGADRKAWQVSYVPVLREMSNGGNSDADEDPLDGFQGVFLVEGLTEIRFTERGVVMAELVGVLLKG
jgi:tetratricopeptide (TPR) repeat protein